MGTGALHILIPVHLWAGIIFYAIICTMKKSLKIFVFLLIVLFLQKPGYATEQFDTGYDVFYDVSNDGETQVTQDISIKNKQSDVVATSYNLSINKMSIYDVKGSDRAGELEFEVEVNGPITKISTNFNEQVIGIDRTLNWQLKYKSKDIATKVGEIWNINIPKVDILESTKEYNTTLKVPISFGSEIYISPKPTEKEQDDKFYIYKYNKESLTKTGITASFGSYQILNFQLSYKLENESSIANYQEIALPPSIKGIQQIKYDSIEPLPERVYIDTDGNMMALYKVAANSQLEIKASGSVRIAGKQINPEFGGKFEDINDNFKVYLREQPFWETTSDPIKRIANELYDPNLNVTQNAQKVYNYVVNELEYNFDINSTVEISRNGALKTIVEPGPVACMEFTDLFIAIARSQGIPARELNGYALTTESNLTPLSISLKSGDLLHSWAEFYDPNYGWIQIDPTWGNTSKIDYFTKLDTNHFVFVIKGRDSEYPYPAGTYKIDGTEKQVEVDIAQDSEIFKFREDVTFYKKLTLNPIKLFTDYREYNVYNSGGIWIFNINNSGVDVLPFETKTLAIKRGTLEVPFETFNGESKYLQFESTIGQPPTKSKANSSLYLSALLALVLCMIVYVLAIHPNRLRRLIHRLLLRLRGPNQ